MTKKTTKPAKKSASRVVVSEFEQGLIKSAQEAVKCHRERMFCETDAFIFWAILVSACSTISFICIVL